MIDIKRDIILSEGVPVNLTAVTGEITPTVALIGRAVKQFNSTVSLEAHRRGQLLPDVPVNSGDVLENAVSHDKYLVIATMDEFLGGEKSATIIHMIACNTQVTISSISETVSPRGDIKKTDVVKVSDLDTFAQAMNAQMLQQHPGILIESQYIIYAPTQPINTLDKIKLRAGAEVIPLKVIDTDYISYPGMVLIQASTETRL